MGHLFCRKRRDHLHHEAPSQEPDTATAVQETPHPIDEPLGLSDVPSDDDLFHIDSYIKGLTEFIEGCSTPMTISIQGDWGTGKTSIMRQVMKRLEDDNKKAAATDAVATSDKACEGPYRTIWFNTWQFSQTDMDDDLAVALLTSLVDEFSADDDNKERLREKVYSSIGSVARRATQMASVIAANIIVGDATAEKVNGLWSPKECNSYVDSVKTLKDGLQEAINNKLNLDKPDKECSERFVIFIDDLDRLKPERTIELLEVLKNFLDCRHCVFVIAADYHAIVAGAKAKYGDGFSDEKGRNFFDKIIQLEFRVPTDFYVEESFIKDSLQRLGFLGDGISDDSELVKTHKRLIKASVTTNPRSMIRLFNSYKLMSLVMKNLEEHPKDDNEEKEIKRMKRNAGGNEAWNLLRDELLFATMCMQTRFRKFYKLLVRYAGDNTDDPESAKEDLESLTKLIQDGTFADHEADDRNDGAAETGVSREFLTELQKLLGMQLKKKPDGKIEEVTFNDDRLKAFHYILRHSITTSAEDLSLTPQERTQETNYRILSEVKRRLAEESAHAPATPEEEPLNLPEAFGKAELTRSKLTDTGGVYFTYEAPNEKDIEYLVGLTKTNEDDTLLRFRIKCGEAKSFDERYKQYFKNHDARPDRYLGNRAYAIYEEIEENREDEDAVIDKVVERMKPLLQGLPL